MTYYCPCSPGRLQATVHDHSVAAPEPRRGVRGDDDPSFRAYIAANFHLDGTPRVVDGVS
jgi:hypothetical protein